MFAQKQVIVNSEQQMKKILQAVPQGILIVSLKDMALKFANDSMRNFLNPRMI